jgi:hypothetical protein
MMSPDYLFALRCRSNPASNGGNWGDRVSKINQDRDMCALHKFIGAVKRRGVVEEDLFNVPSVDLAEGTIKPLMHRGDLIVCTTRWPAHDQFDDARKRVPPGDNWLENQILVGMDRFFQWCSRKHVLLTGAGASCLAQDYADRASIRFQVTDDEARYKQRCGLSDRPMPPRCEIARLVQQLGPEEREARLDKLRKEHLHLQPWVKVGAVTATAGYIVYLQEVWEGGPSLLSLFGMSGPITHGFASAVQEIWNHEFGENVLDALDFRESELIFVEIRPTGDQLVPMETPAHPKYWRTWDLTWNRRGRSVDWPKRCPARPVRGNESQVTSMSVNQ